MSTQATFRQSDVTRAVKAVEASGRHVASVRVERDGTIVVILARSGDAEQAEDGEEKWDVSQAKR